MSKSETKNLDDNESTPAFNLKGPKSAIFVEDGGGSGFDGGTVTIEILRQGGTIWHVLDADKAVFTENGFVAIFMVDGVQYRATMAGGGGAIDVDVTIISQNVPA